MYAMQDPLYHCQRSQAQGCDQDPALVLLMVLAAEAQMKATQHVLQHCKTSQHLVCEQKPDLLLTLLVLLVLVLPT